MGCGQSTADVAEVKEKYVKDEDQDKRMIRSCSHRLVDSKNIYWVFYMPGGAGFLPSTVGSMGMVYLLFSYIWLIFIMAIIRYYC